MAKLQTLSGSKRARIEIQPQRQAQAQPQPRVPRVFENLPLDMFAHIFSFLPIKEAAQKSTLGTRFRNSHRFNQKFMFGRDFAMRGGRNRELLTKLVDRLFDAHKGGEIDVFQLYINPVGIEELLQKWLNICVQKQIKDLDLYFPQPGFALTADFIKKLTNLNSLKLVHSELELPPLDMLRSMGKLRSLILWHVPLSDEKFETLISRCRMITTIDLLHCVGLSRVEIHHRSFLRMLRIAGCRSLTILEVESPSLKCVHFSGHIPATIRFETPQLTEALFNFAPVGNRRYLQASVLENLVSGIPYVTLLTASAVILEALTAKYRRGVISEASYNLLNLKELHLIMDGALFCNPYDILMFMKHCPLLGRLFIDLDDYSFECGPYWALHQKPKLDKFDHYFDKLKYIKLKGFKFLQSELQLVKILLKRARNLEALIFITPKNGRIRLWKADAPRYEQLFDSWKASPQVRIVLFEHTADRTLVRASRSKDWLLFV